MYKVLILFGPPVDEDAFARHFENTHRPLLDAVPNREAIGIDWIAGSVIGEVSVHLLAELKFATQAAMQDGLNSAAGQEMARDYPNFASGGVTILLSSGDRPPIDATDAS